MITADMSGGEGPTDDQLDAWDAERRARLGLGPRHMRIQRGGPGDWREYTPKEPESPLMEFIESEKLIYPIGAIYIYLYSFAGHGAVEDLRRARVHLDRLIERETRGQPKG